MTIKFTNNAATSLASGITNVATSLTVASGKGALFPTLSGSDIFYVTLTNSSGVVEIVQVTARSTDTFTIVRGQDGTTAVAWNTGDKVELRPTAGVLGAMVQSANLQVGGTPTTGTAGSSNYLRGDGAWSTPVTSNVAGTGISVSGATGAITITNSGVTSAVAGTNISVSGATGAVTISASAYPITSGTAVASTSGTAIDFTGIPSWVKRITVIFRGVSTTGTSPYLVQAGTSGGATTSGYLGGAASYGAGAGGSSANYTTGFGMGGTFAAATTLHGSMVITNISSNSWVASFSGGLSDGPYAVMGGGSVSLSGTLDRVRITTVNGTDTFDAGSINILYE